MVRSSTEFVPVSVLDSAARLFPGSVAPDPGSAFIECAYCQGDAHGPDRVQAELFASQIRCEANRDRNVACFDADSTRDSEQRTRAGEVGNRQSVTARVRWTSLLSRNEISMTSHSGKARRSSGTLLAFAASAAVVLIFATTAGAAIVPTVQLATAANYSVLAGSTVTNTGPSTLGASLGLSPGTAVTGFPPGKVLAPGTIDKTNAAAAKAQADLTAAYVNAAGRPINATTKADLGNLTLSAGVYAGPSHGALSLTGPLTLDGAGNANSVFIFQTHSTLITASSSTVRLINGASACNVYWQVGSSATLGTGSVFVGNILALTSITVNNSVTVHGRALARNGAVTLHNDTFTKPTCAASTPATTTTTTTTTAAPATTVITSPPTTGTPTSTLARTGSSNGPLIAIGFSLATAGLAIAGLTKRRWSPN